MPAGQPFTRLCQVLSQSPLLGRADLHLHSTCSDGTYTPEQVVRLAQRCGLAAMALTDHDTLAGISLARQAGPSGMEIIPAVEITTEHGGRELHLLAYFVSEDSRPLNDALAWTRQQRSERFRAMVDRLRQGGVAVPWQEHAQGNPHALGRRYLAELLVQAGQVGSVREAFARYLKDGSPCVVPRKRLDVAEAIRLVRQAGGVPCWAHPGAGCDWTDLVELAQMGLGAVEVEYPAVSRSRRQELRHWATQLKLAITGGSDCHGPGRREVGCCSISAQELEILRQAAGDKVTG